MSREIKFRGKYNNIKWVYGVPVSNGNGQLFMVDGMIGGWDIDPETVGQFTGLKDKNGVDVYEGDIVQDGTYKKYRITWGVSSCGFIALSSDRTSNVYSAYHLAPKVKVIGNKFDNPELLEAK